MSTARIGNSIYRRVANSTAISEEATFVLNALTDSEERAFKIAGEIATSSSDAVFQIVEDFILKEGPASFPELVEKSGRSYVLSDLGVNVVERAGFRLYKRVEKVTELLQDWVR